MKNLARIGITLIALVMTISTKAQIPNFSWAVGSNSQGGEGVIFGGIKSDNAGNIYTAGAFGGNTLTLGAYSISHASINNGGNYGDLFFSKQDAAGNFLWLKTFVALDSISTTLCSDMNIDENGNMVASFDFGAFYPTSALVFDSDTIYPRINGAWAGSGGYKGIIAFDANGNVLWHKVIYKNAAAGVNFHTESIVADNLGSFVVTGTFNISDTIPMIFDAVNLPKPYPASAADIWIIKFNAGGSVVYAKTIAGTGLDAQSIVKADDSGNIYLSCAFSSDTLWFGSSYILNSAGGGVIFPQDLAYLKIDANGNLDWIKSIPLGSGPATGIFPNIASAVNSNGEMFFAGMFKGTFNFGASTVTPSMFILKADANGNPSWATTIGDTVKSGAVQDLEKDVSGNLNIIGIYNTDSININNQTYFNTAPGSASADAFYIKTNASGVPLQVFTYGSDGADGIRLAVGPGSTVNLAGPFKGQSLILGSNTLTNGDFPNNDIYWTSFSSLVGIAETDFHSQINFYPNPAIEKITVDLGYQSQSTCINVTNLIGENVISRCISDASSFDLDVASLKPGFYLLNLNGEKGILTSKFVKQ